MEEELALMSICKILGSYIVQKRELLKCISRDHSPEVTNFLQPRCGSMLQLESFLTRHPEHLMVENDMVCINSAQLIRGREGAVTYYSDKLSKYVEPCHYMNLRGHIGQANKDIWAFIETFYHEEDFIDFLLAHPDDFVIFDDDTVHQLQKMEERSVVFYRKCLEKFGEGLYFTDFRGHYTHSKYVRQYIQQCYPEDYFLIFLQNNDDVFNLEDGCVYLR